MRNFVDLHTHSRASDGQLSPSELVALAEAKRLAAVALTDHDTTAGLAQARGAAEGLGVRLVSGVEISAAWPVGALHILGLGFDLQSPQLNQTLASLRQARDLRNPRMLDRLRELGVPVEMAELEEMAGMHPGGTGFPAGAAQPGKAVPPGGTGFQPVPAGTGYKPVPPVQCKPPVIGRLHMALAMVRRGYVCDVKEAFERYLAHGRPAYVDKERLTPAQAIAAIHAAGGVALVAHPPQLLYQNSAQLERMVHSLRRDGLDGIEVYHPQNTPAQTRLHLDLARRLKLLISGGSDFHGSFKDRIRLGQARVPLAAVIPLLTRIGVVT
jgi:hypothetical protein